MRAAKVVPRTGCVAKINMLVKFDPTSSSDAAFDMSMVPKAKATSSLPRARAALSATGVMNTTDVSRFNSAVTIATKSIATAKRATSFPGVRATN